MAKLAKLIMEPEKVNTTLAETYLNKYKNFDDWPSSGIYWVLDYPDHINKYKYEDSNPHSIPYEYQTPQAFVKSAYLGRRLSELIKENEAMFCQLEKISRNTAVEDVKNSITLMSQHLQCSNTLWCSEYTSTLTIVMDDKTPLHILGCVAAALYIKDVRAKIVTSKIVAPLCHLFVNLCSQVGWKIPLIYIDSTEEFISNLDTQAARGIIRGVNEQTCTAVVTEQADVDSALDSIIYSSATAPWKLRQVFVQENVYEEFKSGLAWKTERTSVYFSSDAFVAQGKMFICDQFRNSPDGIPVEISIEAYRTVKELFGLMKQRSTPFLSVWAESSGLSHEIAQGASSVYIWMNDYAAFYGPPQACLPVYEQLYPKNYNSIKKSTFNHPASKIWRDCKIDERKNIMMKALHAHNLEDSDLEELLQNAVLNWHRDSLVYMDDGKFCFVLEQPAVDGVITYIPDVRDQKDLVKIINFTLNGHIVIYELFPGCDIQILVSLEKAGVSLLKNDSNYDLDKDLDVPFFNKLKVFHTRFGTIFAN